MIRFNFDLATVIVFMENALKVTDNEVSAKNIYIPRKPSLLIATHHCIYFGPNCNIKFIIQLVQSNKSVVPSNEAPIMSGNKPSFSPIWYYKTTCF